jgi:hypothetical protein
VTVQRTTPVYRPVVVLRYHDHFDIVRQRLLWTRKLNPHVPVYGLYGGSKPVPEALVKLFDDNLTLDMMPELAFRNMDLALLDWYREVGTNIDFSHAYVSEWDLVYLKPLTAVMPQPEPGQSLLTGYIPLAWVEWKWPWTNGKKQGALNEWLELKRFVAERYHAYGPYYACLGPGTVLSREFFEGFNRLELPLLCHDEIRVPLIHHIFGLKVASTDLYPPMWYEPKYDDWIRRFNGRHWEVAPKAVAEAQKEGFAAFHPVTKLLDERLLRRALSR